MDSFLNGKLSNAHFKATRHELAESAIDQTFAEGERELAREEEKRKPLSMGLPAQTLIRYQEG